MNLRAGVACLVVSFAVTTNAPNVSLLAPGGATVEGAVAIAPNNSFLAVAAGIRTSSGVTVVDTFRSHDGGTTWIANGPLPLTAGSVTLTKQWDPVLAFDRTGTAFLTVVGETTTGLWTIVVYRSTDGGGSWTGVDAAQNKAGNSDKPWLAIDNSGGAFDGSLYLTWYTFGGGVRGMHIARSRDHGITWNEAPVMTTGGWPFIAAGADGSVYASFYGIESDVDVARSTDGGVTFASPVRAAPQPFSTSFGTIAHQIAADVSAKSTRGNLYAVYPCETGICFVRSLDRGATWSSPKTLSQAGNDAGLPSVTVDPVSGEVLVSWMNRPSGSVSAALYATRSLDGGGTFEAPQPFSDLVAAQQAAGDYNQNASVGANRLAIFSDSAGRLSVARVTWPNDPPPSVAPVRRRSARP